MKKFSVLVTGGNGFVAGHCIVALLKRGYRVNTTLRTMSKEADLREMLKKQGIHAGDNLKCFHADLTSDKNWAKAMAGCQYVLSVASPVFFGKQKDEHAVMRPALEGIERVLRFSRLANIKRVVMTSNFGAIGFSQCDKTRETTEADWTDTEMKGLSLYEKSKTLAEKAAWKNVKEQGGLEFTTINPVAILGPSLDGHVSGSFVLLDMLLSGALKATPNLPLNIIDVRDVADLHVLALESESAGGQRFIGSADGQISMYQMARLIKNHAPDFAHKVSTRRFPDWMLKVMGVFNHQAKEAATMLKINRKISTLNAKARLEWTPKYTQEQAILAALDSLQQWRR